MTAARPITTSTPPQPNPRPLSPVKQRPHAVIPELDDPVVQGREDPWSDGVERQPLHPVALGLELGQHDDAKK